MADTVYAQLPQFYMNGGTLNLASANIKFVLVDTNDYTPNFDTDEFLDDIPAGAQVALSPNLTGVTVVNGVLDAADPTIAAVTGDESEAVVAFVDTGTPATSRLISFHDGFTFIPQGNDLLIQINASGICRL